MSYDAVAEVDRFLERHPTFTSDLDNPVELLEDLRRDYDAVMAERDAIAEELSDLKAGHGGPEALAIASQQIADLVAFCRRLNAERKISDFELREALALGKRIPSHRAECSP